MLQKIGLKVTRSLLKMAFSLFLCFFLSFFFVLF